MVSTTKVTFRAGVVWPKLSVAVIWMVWLPGVASATG